MIQVPHYDLLGLYPQIESFDLDAALERWNELKGKSPEKSTLAVKLTCCAAHYFGLSISDFKTDDEMVKAIMFANHELEMH